MSYGPTSLSWASSASARLSNGVGMKPGDLPVEQPTEFELVVNRKTLRALGLTLPRSVEALVHDNIE